MIRYLARRAGHGLLLLFGIVNAVRGREQLIEVDPGLVRGH